MARRRLSGRLAPSIADVLFASVLFKTLVAGRDLLNCGDTGWHIATGVRILDSMTIPSHDPYSHTAAGAPWVAHEWLSEVVFAVLHKAMGLNGVIVLTAVTVSLIFFLLYKYMLRTGTGALTAALFTIFAVLASSGHWLARPHMFSLGLTLYFFATLEDYQERRANRLWSLPAVMILWVNVHAGFFIGIVLLCIYALSNLAGAVLEPGGTYYSKDMSRSLGITAAATVVATLANPSGAGILSFPFHLMGREFVMDNVQEWASTNFHSEKLFELALILVLAVVVLATKRLRLHELLILLLLTHMSLVSVRFVELFSVIALPLAAGRAGDAFSGLVRKLRPSRLRDRVVSAISVISSSTDELERRPRSHVWVYASIALCFAIAANGGTALGARLMDYSYNPARFPVRAMDFTSDKGMTGRMFNNDGWGGYIIYRGIPGNSVFFDGRYDMYSVELLKEYLAVARTGLKYPEVLDKFGVDLVMFNSGSPLCMLLDLDRSWSLVYSDGTADVFLRDIPENSRLISEYGISDSPYRKGLEGGRTHGK